MPAVLVVGQSFTLCPGYHIHDTVHVLLQMCHRLLSIWQVQSGSSSLEVIISILSSLYACLRLMLLHPYMYIRRVKNVSCDLCRESAWAWAFASSSSSSVPSTKPHNPLTNSICHIWNFNVVQFVLSNLLIDHLSSTAVILTLANSWSKNDYIQSSTTTNLGLAWRI